MARVDSSHDRAAVNVGSAHLATLRLMRVAAVGDHAAALDHAIAVLERAPTLEALNASVEDWLIAIGEQMDCAIAQAEKRPGGQQVSPSGGDFWPVPVGVVQRFKWWSRESRRRLATLAEARR